MTVVLSKQEQPNVGPTTNWLRLLDMVEIAINNAPISNTELSPFYLNLGYYSNFWFDVPNFDEVKLEGGNTIQVRDWIKEMQADWHLSTVRCIINRHWLRHLVTANGPAANSRCVTTF